MVFKPAGKYHGTRQLDGGSYSHRVFLPGRDPAARVKMTLFTAVEGAEFKDVCYPVDETVHITFGHGFIRKADGEILEVSIGASYYVPAGEMYSLICTTQMTAVCFFSQAADGTLPQDEPDLIKAKVRAKRH